MMLETIYLATQMFDQVYLFQPLVSGSDSDEIYLILKNALSERKDYYIPLQNLMNKIPDFDKIKGFLSSPLPQSFIQEILQKKNIFIDKQVETLSEIQNYLRLYNNPKLSEVDVQLKLAEWALPDAY